VSPKKPQTTTEHGMPFSSSFDLILYTFFY